MWTDLDHEVVAVQEKTWTLSVPTTYQQPPQIQRPPLVGWSQTHTKFFKPTMYIAIEAHVDRFIDVATVSTNKHWLLEYRWSTNIPSNPETSCWPLRLWWLLPSRHLTGVVLSQEETRSLLGRSHSPRSCKQDRTNQVFCLYFQLWRNPTDWPV